MKGAVIEGSIEVLQVIKTRMWLLVYGVCILLFIIDYSRSLQLGAELFVSSLHKYYSLIGALCMFMFLPSNTT